MDAHIGSYIFYEDLYRSNLYDNIHNSLCPSVCYLPEIRSSVSSYLSSISLPASLFTHFIIHHLVTNSLVVCLQADDVSRPRCDPILKELDGPTKDRSAS